MNQSAGHDDSLQQLTDKLWEFAGQIRELESSADKALEEGYDLKKHEELLKRKASLLASLPDQVEFLVEALPEQVGEKAEQQLHTFARNASNALNVGSVFYMRQLLYPDDHQKGQDNDLEKFIRSLSD